MAKPELSQNEKYLRHLQKQQLDAARRLSEFAGLQFDFDQMHPATKRRILKHYTPKVTLKELKASLTYWNRVVGQYKSKLKQKELF